MNNNVVEIVVAVISAVATIVAVIITARSQRKDLLAELQRSSDASDARLDKAIAVTNTKMDELTREVREHNNFARRMPVVEEQIKVINHRISDLERQKD